MATIDAAFITANEREFLTHLKSRWKVIHHSNIFFRDLQYGVASYLRQRGISISYRDAERLARDVARSFEQQRIFKAIDHQTWLLEYPEFALPRAEKKGAPAA